LAHEFQSTAGSDAVALGNKDRTKCFQRATYVLEITARLKPIGWDASSIEPFFTMLLAMIARSSAHSKIVLVLSGPLPQADINCTRLQ
jgi:hypothetical protein